MTPDDSHASTLPQEAPLPWWKHPRSQAVFKVTAVLTVVAVVVWFFCFHPYVSTDDARVAGTLVRLAPEGASGRVVTVNVVEGSRVHLGDVLVELDHRVPQANLQRAQAKARLAALEQRRISQLVAQRAAPQKDLDKAQADLDASQAELNLAQVSLDNTYLKSPIDGIVVQKTVEVGNILEPGQSALALLDVDHAWVAANLEETEVGNVRPGQKVSISVDEGGRLTGKVLEVRAAAASSFALIPAENTSGNFTKLVQRIPIKVALDPHPGRDLRIGQSVVIRIRVR